MQKKRVLTQYKNYTTSQTNCQEENEKNFSGGDHMNTNTPQIHYRVKTKARKKPTPVQQKNTLGMIALAAAGFAMAAVAAVAIGCARK